MEEYATASAMCRADGLDPDEIITVHSSGPNGQLVAITQRMPRWQSYAPEARRFIAALKANGGLS